MELVYNQSILAKMTRVASHTIARATVQLGIPVIDPNSSIKRYGIHDVVNITSHVFSRHERPIAKKTQVFYNFKGGTGKTSLCYQVATHLAVLGFKVLALDLDPQGHLSLAMQIREDWSGPTIYDVLIGGEHLEDCTINVFPNLDLLPANIAMTRIEVPLFQKAKREEKLNIALEKAKKEYDFIIIDTNPTISVLNLSALVASDRINIVCETQPFSLSGLRVLMKETTELFQEMRMSPDYCIIPNKYEIKTATAQEVLGALRAEYGGYVMGSVVRKSEDINISAKKKLPLTAFCKARSPAFEDVMDLVHEIIVESQVRAPASRVKLAAAMGA